MPVNTPNQHPLPEAVVPAEPVRVSAEASARVAAEGRELRREIRRRMARMEVVLPAGHPIRAR